MVFGVLKDIKIGENRVMITPEEVVSLIEDGHTVLAQRDCGVGSRFSTEQYAAAGAEIVETMEEMYERCDMLVKVKELEPSEFHLLRENQIIMCCMHPASRPLEVPAILESKIIAFTSEDAHRYGSPNCEAAGKQGALFALECMQTHNGGKGKYIGGLAGAPCGNVLILGGGTVGRNALSVFHALGARVTIMDINVGVLRNIEEIYGNSVNTLFCTKEGIRKVLPQTDIVLNCVKWPLERKDFLIEKDMLLLMEPGSVLVDISDDNPGAIESSHHTYHDNPRYVVNGVVHFSVGNIPGAIAQSTSIAYAAEMLPHFQNILNLGVKEACVRDGYLRRSLTAYKGILTHEGTSVVFNLPWMRPEDALEINDRKLDPAPPTTSTRSTNYIKK